MDQASRLRSCYMNIIIALIVINLVQAIAVSRYRASRRWWVRPDLWVHNQLARGAHANIFGYFHLSNHEQFYNFTRMMVPQFTFLHELIAPRITRHCQRIPLFPEQILACVLK